MDSGLGLCLGESQDTSVKGQRHCRPERFMQHRPLLPRADAVPCQGRRCACLMRNMHLHLVWPLSLGSLKASASLNRPSSSFFFF